MKLLHGAAFGCGSGLQDYDVKVKYNLSYNHPGRIV